MHPRIARDYLMGSPSEGLGVFKAIEGLIAKFWK